MRLNVRRGLFRLWLVLSCVWVLIVAAISFEPVKEEFGKAASMKSLEAASWVPDVPVDCRGARVSEFRREGSLCWYSMPGFRKLYPEYKDLNDNELSDKLYARAGVPLTPIRPWTLLAEKVGLAVLPPVAILLLGGSLIWALSGFAKP